jgi:hypothetical protein
MLHVVKHVHQEGYEGLVRHQNNITCMAQRDGKNQSSGCQLPCYQECHNKRSQLPRPRPACDCRLGVRFHDTDWCILWIFRQALFIWAVCSCNTARTSPRSAFTDEPSHTEWGLPSGTADQTMRCCTLGVICVLLASSAGKNTHNFMLA